MDHWWRSPLEGLYPVGECAGTHGVRRPGGAALNSGQVGSIRAAQWIGAHRKPAPSWSDSLENQAAVLENHLLDMLSPGGVHPASCWSDMKKRMDSLSHIRSAYAAQNIAQSAHKDQKQKLSVGCLKELEIAFALEDWLLAQEAMATAVIHYIENGGGSRGSCLIADEDGNLKLPGLNCRNTDRSLDSMVQETFLENNGFVCHFRGVLPLPDEISWFETAWAAYRSGEIYQ